MSAKLFPLRGNYEAAPSYTSEIKDNFMDLIEPSLTAAIIMNGGDFIHKFEVPGAFSRNDGSGVVQQVSILNIGNDESNDVMLWFFAEEPTVASASGAALSITDAEMEKCLCKTPVRSGSFTGATSNTQGQTAQLGLLVKSEGGDTSLWCVASVLADWISVSTTDQLKYRIGILPL